MSILKGKMTNKRFMEMAKKWKNKKVDVKKLEKDVYRREEERKLNVVVQGSELGKQKENNNLINLESKVGFSTHITNEVELEAEGQIVKYVGDAEELYFNGDRIRGRARLRRYDLKEKIKRKRKLVSLIPIRIESEDIPLKKWTKRWEIVSGEYNYDFFLSRGKSSKNYIDNLKGNAANQRINLSHELFEAVFAPIDKKIIEIYEKFYNK